MEHVALVQEADLILIRLRASHFLWNMVRNIVGSLIKVGCGEQPVSWIAELLAVKDRTKAAATAKPNGLYLVDVTYPEAFDLPRKPLGPLFLPES